jgi:hypothetical protein
VLLLCCHHVGNSPLRACGWELCSATADFLCLDVHFWAVCGRRLLAKQVPAFSSNCAALQVPCFADRRA